MDAFSRKNPENRTLTFSKKIFFIDQRFFRADLDEKWPRFAPPRGGSSPPWTGRVLDLGAPALPDLGARRDVGLVRS